MPYLNPKLTANTHFGFTEEEGTIIKDALKRQWVNGKGY